MPTQTMTLVFNGDARGANAAMGSIESNAKSLTNTLQREITSKMKMIFSAAAIEQAAQRTGQWAQELMHTSKAMGIATETLQTLSALAAETNTPKEAVLGMFESIDKARNDALSGNTELLLSFKKLGVELTDLQKMKKSELFGKVMGNSKMANIGNEDAFLRRGVQSMTGGTSEIIISQLASGLQGRGGFDQYKDAKKDSGAVLPEEDVSKLGKTWGELMVDLTALGNELKPLAIFLISLFRTIVKAVTAVIDLFSGFAGIVSGLFSGNFDKIQKSLSDITDTMVGAFYGVLKGLYSLFDMLGKGLLGAITSIMKLLNKIPGMRGNFDNDIKTLNEMKETTGLTKYAEKDEQQYKGKYKVNNSKFERGEALGDVAAIIASGGEAGIAKLGAMGTAKLAGYAKAVGMRDTAASMTYATRSLNRTAAGQTGLVTAKPLPETIAEAILGRYGVTGKTAAAVGAPIAKLIRAGVGLGGIGGVTESGTKQIRTEKYGEAGHIPQFGEVFNKTGGDSAMLKMGNIFGSNFQSRMVVLNTKMVELLSQIQVNTRTGGTADKYVNPPYTNNNQVP